MNAWEAKLAEGIREMFKCDCSEMFVDPVSTCNAQGSAREHKDGEACMSVAETGDINCSLTTLLRYSPSAVLFAPSYMSVRFV